MSAGFIPADAGYEAEELLTRVVWYYYVGGLTQQQVAEKLGLTRLRVNRIIGQARTEGAVRFDIQLPMAGCVALAEGLRVRFGLTEAVVVPSLDDVQETQRVIGEAAGTLLNTLLDDGVKLGVGWGRTLWASVRNLSSRRLARSHVVTLMGSLTRGSGINTVGVATAVANRIGAECHYLAAPIYCPTTEIRSALMAHPGLEEVLDLASKVDVAVISAGDMSPLSILVSTNIVSQELESLKKAGAVGDILATFLGSDGIPIDHPLRSRVMGLAPETFQKIPVRLLASGGAHKEPVLRAALRGNYVTHLVTDELVARMLLEAESAEEMEI
ncbi:sugar-binding transcriptional regulator [Aureimonas fodinaquatilis]|uniref:Sugar-binding transcriptional regulator n=1 Tax=Aureimonas fodinaquatilis TaxID=2565783 RepID=A0A5B0DX25_9HYPH|nr:sugar-binding transcriptional regulator [Aureimonas fodinaquatilis]